MNGGRRVRLPSVFYDSSPAVMHAPLGVPALHASFPDFILCKPERLCYSGGGLRRLFPGSSVVEQPAVNRLVAGSNPARGATFLRIFPPSLNASGRHAKSEMRRHHPTTFSWAWVSSSAPVPHVRCAPHTRCSRRHTGECLRA